MKSNGCLTHCFTKGDTLYYLVEWKGYGPEDNTWEREANLLNCQRKISSFYVAVNERYPDGVVGSNRRHILADTEDPESDSVFGIKSKKRKLNNGNGITRPLVDNSMLKKLADIALLPWDDMPGKVHGFSYTCAIIPRNNDHLLIAYNLID